MTTMTTEEETAAAKSARAWLLSRGYIHPSSMVTCETMESEVQKLEYLMFERQDGSSPFLFRAAEAWSKTWSRRLKREKEQVWGETDGRAKVKGRSQKKAAKAEESRAIRNAMRSKKGSK